ncbi:MAG TPA: sulfotransferase, partial [Chitinophagaceae bacterium]|nr:sulfotransferase [Chitinophagaceae bacterium]
MHGEFLKNFVPVKLVSDGNGRLCQWLNTTNKKFTEPFFDDTIRICKNLPENRHSFKSASVLQMLPLWSAEMKFIDPTAFIFHVSRCGSTLLSQLLALDPKNIVLSEVPFLDEVMRLPFNPNRLSVEESDNYFREALRFYGQQRDQDESSLFVKLDSWHLLFYDRLRKLYPKTPFIILYRSPADIIRSQKRSRGMQSVPGLIEKEVFGFTETDLTTDLDLYMSRVLEKYYSEILRITTTDENFLLVNYDQGILSIIKRCLSRLGITPEPGYLKKMEARME